jgi:hypothetical protein
VLILDGLCLHVLSSFQRTGWPTARPLPLRLRPSPGEPFKYTTGLAPCQLTRGRPTHSRSAITPSNHIGRRLPAGPLDASPQTQRSGSEARPNRTELPDRMTRRAKRGE